MFGHRIDWQPLTASVEPLPRTFHPKLTVHIENPLTPAETPANSTCHAIFQLALPDALFADPDELEGLWGPRGLTSTPQASSSDGRGKQSEVAQAVRWAMQPAVIDIERPILPDGSSRARERYGDVSALWLAIPFEDDRTGDYDQKLSMALRFRTKTVHIPLHGRYLVPHDSGYRVISVAADVHETDVRYASGGGEGRQPYFTGLRGGWTCASIDDVESHLGNELQLLPTIHLQSPLELTLPTGHPSHQVPVEFVTALCIWVGWAYLMRKLWRVLARHRSLSSGTRKIKTT